MNSLMTNDNVKIFPHDKILAKTLLKLIPQEVYPNHLTVLRVLMTPVILYFLWSEKWSVVVPLFLAAALTDLLDGSLARTRKRITTWGTVAD
jgi:phosphatidylglycerophosphate synthase